MTEFFHFAAESPFLTFFLFLVIGGAITESFKWIAYAIKGPPPASKEEDTEDE
jgi:hypothetical protein